MGSLLNYAAYFSFVLIILQIINQLILLFSPKKSSIVTHKYFTWGEVNRFVVKLAKMINDKNRDYGCICGTGRGGGILAALLSYKMGLKPVIVIDRDYIIDDSNGGERSSECMVQKVIMSPNYEHLKEKRVLLITPQSDPGITLNKYKKVLMDSGFTGGIDKCAILKSDRTMDSDIEFCLYSYGPSSKCRRFPWEKHNPDKMEGQLPHRV